MLVVVASCEVALREGASRAGFQVSLEPDRLSLHWEHDGDDHGPRPMFSGVSRRSGIVPINSALDVAGDADVVPRRIPLTSENIREPFTDASHVLVRCTALTGK